MKVLDFAVGFAVFAGPVLDETAWAVGDFGECGVSLGGGDVVVGRADLFGEVEWGGVDGEVCGAEDHAQENQQEF